MTTFDLQTIRYINLLDSTAKVKTRKCFNYNNMIIFAVPRALMAKAIGPGASHIHSIQEKLGKKIRIIGEANDVEEAEKFIKDIVAPITFHSLEIKEGTLILTAGSQSKAALIGRNRRREDELQQIIKDTFGMDLKIV
ncbi:hypothetical protein FJZ18_02625 [Candidatus Pacearchaeota archaeon]|nr:hypothetical protein [Candidatus Pacearchaeota archaeon]